MYRSPKQCETCWTIAPNDVETCPQCGHGVLYVLSDIGETVEEIAGSIHELAKEKGWHDDNETEDHFIERTCNNIHNEVSELHEAWRNNKLRNMCDKHDMMVDEGIEPLTCLEEELADIIIRALDASKKLGVDIQRAIELKHEFNKTRSTRHDGKRS